VNILQCLQISTTQLKTQTLILSIMNKINIFFILMLFFIKSYSVDTLFIVFDAKAKNQSLTSENSLCQHLKPHFSKICLVTNYYKIKGIVPDKSDNCFYYEFVFYNYTVVDSACHNTFMDTLVMGYKDLFKRPNGSLVPWFDENYLRHERDPIILDSQYIGIKRKDVFFLSDLTNKESLGDLIIKIKASINTIYLVDITDGLLKRLYSYKVSWYNQQSK